STTLWHTSQRERGKSLVNGVREVFAIMVATRVNFEEMGREALNIINPELNLGRGRAQTAKRAEKF
ncbi:MAG TPA: hypothetical protein PK152_21245, partial [Anaerolineales bacterium]|nr:hypothetical protein [Anaerolineales bacterium]